MLVRVDVVVVGGPMRGKVFSFAEPDRFLFGRSEQARCSLPNDGYVSRHHFLLEIAPPRVSLHDLRSKNGTFVNGVRYGGTKPPAPGVRTAPGAASDIALKHGDEVQVGDTVLKVAVVGDAPAAPAAAAAAPAGGGGPVTLSHPGVASGVAPPAIYESWRRSDASDPMALLGAVLEAAAAEPSRRPGEPAFPGYEVLGVLGEGGMGKVFKARERAGARRLVAIKTILPMGTIGADAIATFQRETDITRQLRHPNIVEFLDGGCAAGTFFLVLEFVDGMDLGKLLVDRGGRMSLAEAAPLVLDALEGLAHAHTAPVQAEVVGPGGRGHALQRFQGVVHRDLKPQNILLERRPGGGFRAKIADLGLAKVYGAAGMTDMTSPDAMGGTPIYWPLEQITEYRYLKPSADVFSMGAILFQLLTGRTCRPGFERLARAAPFHALCAVIVTETPVPIATYAPEVPRPVAAVVDRALSDRPEARYANAAALRDALREALSLAGSRA